MGRSTLSDQRRLMKVVVGVEYGSSSAQVKEILLGVARYHPRVQQSPPVEVLNYGPGRPISKPG